MRWMALGPPRAALSPHGPAGLPGVLRAGSPRPRADGWGAGSARHQPGARQLGPAPPRAAAQVATRGGSARLLGPKAPGWIGGRPALRTPSRRRLPPGGEAGARRPPGAGPAPAPRARREVVARPRLAPQGGRRSALTRSARSVPEGQGQVAAAGARRGPGRGAPAGRPAPMPGAAGAPSARRAPGAAALRCRGRSPHRGRCTRGSRTG